MAEPEADAKAQNLRTRIPTANTNVAGVTRRYPTGYPAATSPFSLGYGVNGFNNLNGLYANRFGGFNGPAYSAYGQGLGQGLYPGAYTGAYQGGYQGGYQGYRPLGKRSAEHGYSYYIQNDDPNSGSSYSINVQVPDSELAPSEYQGFDNRFGYPGQQQQFGPQRSFGRQRSPLGKRSADPEAQIGYAGVNRAARGYNSGVYGYGLNGAAFRGYGNQFRGNRFAGGAYGGFGNGLRSYNNGAYGIGRGVYGYAYGNRYQGLF